MCEADRAKLIDILRLITQELADAEHGETRDALNRIKERLYTILC